MGVCRQEFDLTGSVFSVTHDRMHGRGQFHSLKIAILARVIIWPQNAWRTGIVGGSPFRIGFRILRVEVIRGTDAAQRTKRDTKILMVARSKNHPASFTEATDRGAIQRSEPLSNVDAEEPQFVEIALVHLAQHWIISGRETFPVTGRDVKQLASRFILDAGKDIRKYGEPFDRPTVFGVRDCCLQKNLLHIRLD